VYSLKSEWTLRACVSFFVLDEWKEAQMLDGNCVALKLANREPKRCNGRMRL
jgi:hypothetical protein